MKSELTSDSIRRRVAIFFYLRAVEAEMFIELVESLESQLRRSAMCVLKSLGYISLLTELPDF